MLRRRYFISEPTKAEAAFAGSLDAINLAIAGENWRMAQGIAKDWGNQISRQMGMPQRKVWKEFKRDIAQRWFGRPEKRIFEPPWSHEAVLDYTGNFPGRNLRVSSFPENIACHAKSFRLPANQESIWIETLLALDRNVLIEVFPESSTSNSICFRRFGFAFGEEIFYEAGKGQAMPVFEDEQGKHPMVHGYRDISGNYNFRASMPTHKDGREIRKKLQMLIRKYDRIIQSKCSGVCRKTGIDGLGLEGYFNPGATNDLIVVDFDLPFDFVFMGMPGNVDV